MDFFLCVCNKNEGNLTFFVGIINRFTMTKKYRINFIYLCLLVLDLKLIESLGIYRFNFYLFEIGKIFFFNSRNVLV